MHQKHNATENTENEYSFQTLREAYTGSRKPLIIAKGVTIPLHSVANEKGHPMSPYPDNLTHTFNVGDIIEFGHKNGTYYGMINGIAITVNADKYVWIGYDADREIHVLKLNHKEDPKYTSEEYRNSVQGKKEIQKHHEQEKSKNEKITSLNVGIENLNALKGRFDIEKEPFLDWINSYMDIINEVAERNKKNEIFLKFIEIGFRENINTQDSFNAEDPNNYAKYIVGQFLLSLKEPVPNVNHFLKKWILEWLEKHSKDTRDTQKKIDRIKEELGI